MVYSEGEAELNVGAYDGHVLLIHTMSLITMSYHLMPAMTLLSKPCNKMLYSTYYRPTIHVIKLCHTTLSYNFVIQLCHTTLSYNSIDFR